MTTIFANKKVSCLSASRRLHSAHQCDCLHPCADVCGKWYIVIGRYIYDIIRTILYILKFQRWLCGKKLRLVDWRGWLASIGVPVTPCACAVAQSISKLIPALTL